MNAPPPVFSVVSGAQVQQALTGREQQVTDVVAAAYRLHGASLTVNPDSYFLRFPDRPTDRIIALPASIGGEVNTSGIKWIASYPGNVAAGLPRASAVLVLNDTSTGYPYACLEASIISAVRTAASAALAAGRMSDQRGERPRRIGFIGTGLIARYVHTYLTATGFAFDEVGLYDLDQGYARGLAGHLESARDAPVKIYREAEDLVRASDLVVFATTAGTPHVVEPSWFGHHPLVLHLSLRDLAPEVILSAWNLTDDVDHCLKAATSLHLTEQRTGGRDFIAGALPELLDGGLSCPDDRTAIFSPFGLGVLDLAVGRYVYDRVADAGGAVVVPDFFQELRRHG